MDLQTILFNLENRKYHTVAELRADVDLIWDNALLFNGETSWIKKYVDEMRHSASKKFREAESHPPGLARKPSVVRAPSSGFAVRGIGNVPFAKSNCAYFITPQMRSQLLDNVVRLKDAERVQVGQLAQQVCGAAVEVIADGRELKIDVDALEPMAFVRLDVHVRSLIVAASIKSSAEQQYQFHH